MSNDLRCELIERYHSAIHFTADDGYPAMRILSAEELADIAIECFRQDIERSVERVERASTSITLEEVEQRWGSAFYRPNGPWPVEMLEAIDAVHGGARLMCRGAINRAIDAQRAWPGNEETRAIYDCGGDNLHLERYTDGDITFWRVVNEWE